MSITITDAAKKEIKELLTEHGKDGEGLKISVTTGGCSGLEYNLSLDSKQELDNEIDCQDFKVFVDPKSLFFLRGMTIDYNNGLLERGFKFQNPNARSECACKQSFGI